MLTLQDQDTTATRNEFLFHAPPCASAILKDQRDEPVLSLLFNLALFLLCGVPLVCHMQRHIIGALYFVALFTLFFERFVLALHFSTHRRIARSSVLNAIPEYIVAPFLGIPAGMYALHHIMIHHTHGNATPWDITSTEIYQRDRLGQVLLYCFRFMALSVVEIPLNFYLQHQIWACAKSTALILANFGLLAWLLHWYTVPALWIFGAPMLVAPILLSFGNYCQHIFVDPRQPESPFGMTYCLINTRSNQRGFNDGYHTEHHINSLCHWSDLPARFHARVQEYKERDALVFHGDVTFFDIGLWVLTGNYDRLYDTLVQFEEPRLNRSEVKIKLQDRLRPIHRWKCGALVHS